MVNSAIQKKVLVWIYAHTMDEPSELRLLLLKRPQDHGGYWQPVTGKVEESETVQEGALREAQEESSLVFHFGIMPLGFSFEFKSRWTGAPLVQEEAFALRVDLNPNGSLPMPKIDPVEHESFEWVSVSVAEKRLRYDSNRTALEYLLKKLQKVS